MMKTRIKLLCLTLVIAMLFGVFAACQPAAAPAPAPAPAEPVKEEAAPAEPAKEEAAPAAEPDKSYKLVMGGIQSAEDTATKAMQMVADLVKEKTGGTITIEVFPASQLGNATSQVEAVSMGSQDMFVDAGGFISTFAPDKNAESMWFLFRDEAHYRAYLESETNKQIEQKFLDTTGVRVIANNWVRVPRCVASKKVITSIDGFKGLKVRSPDIKAYMDSISALGASPTQIAWGETYLALKQGVVDASEGPLDQLYTMNFYEATMNVIMTNHLRDDLVVTINDALFNKFSEAQKTALVEAANEAGDWYSETCKVAAEANVQLMKDAGCEFHEIDIVPMQEAILQKAMELEADGQWTAGLVEAIINVGK